MNTETELNRYPSTFHPFSNDTVEAWPEPVDGNALLDQLVAVMKRFVILPKWAPETLALWTLHTYAFQLRDVSTYIGLESPEKRCGKTTLLTLLSELVNRPIVAANISSPAFFRLIEETRPTLLIDEADTLLQGNDELRGILNAGYNRKTAYVVRVANLPWTRHKSKTISATPAADHSASRTSQDGTRLARFSCWCPKVIAAIGRLPETLADRCIVIGMQRKALRDECERIRNLDGSPLRRQCRRFVLDQSDVIAHARPQIPRALNDRAADIWEPLFALADIACGPWPDLARQAAEASTANTHEINPIGSLFADIMVIFLGKTVQKIYSHELVAELAYHEDRPWQEALKGKAPTELWLAQQFRPYGIRPKTIWIGNRCSKGLHI